MHYFLAQKNNLKFHKKLHCAKLPPVFCGGTLGIRVFRQTSSCPCSRTSHLSQLICPSLLARPHFSGSLFYAVSARANPEGRCSDPCSAGDGPDEGDVGSRLGWTVSAPQLQPSAACLPHGTRASQNTITKTRHHCTRSAFREDIIS